LVNVDLRMAVSTDLPRLMGMDHTCVSEFVWQLDLRKENGQISAVFRAVRLPRPITVTYPRDPFSLADEWAQRSATIVALVDDEVVGYACILEHSHATTAWITDLVVSMEKRRQGVGSVLMNAAQEWASARGSKNVFLEMPSKNYPAIQLALKSGFEFCGYNDHYYITQDVALFFGRTLL
jgi:ribosomal protein S18 acetylase RimI-like enzyme